MMTMKTKWGAASAFLAMLFVVAWLYIGHDKRALLLGYYSGEFCTGNCSGREVRMLDCSNFGFISPQAGVMMPSQDCGCGPKKFPPLREFPKETTIRWRDEETEKEYSETVNLRGIVPAGVEGVTEFILTAENKWSVRFIPATSENQ